MRIGKDLKLVSFDWFHQVSDIWRSWCIYSGAFPKCLPEILMDVRDSTFSSQITHMVSPSSIFEFLRRLSAAESCILQPLKTTKLVHRMRCSCAVNTETDANVILLKEELRKILDDTINLHFSQCFTSVNLCVTGKPWAITGWLVTVCSRWHTRGTLLILKRTLGSTGKLELTSYTQYTTCKFPPEHNDPGRSRLNVCYITDKSMIHFLGNILHIFSDLKNTTIDQQPNTSRVRTPTLLWGKC